MQKLADNIATISFKVPAALFKQIKKISNARGITMSEFIRNALERQFLKPKQYKEPEWFKYLGKFEEDDDLREFDQILKSQRSHPKNLN